MVTKERIKAGWDYAQTYLDIQGDAVMFVYTSAIIWKTLHYGLNNADAMAYGAAIGALGYSKGARHDKN